MAKSLTKKRREKKYRRSFEFSEGTQKRLDFIKEKTGATSYADVLRSALLLYEDYTKAPASGFEYYKRKIDPDNKPVVISAPD